MAWLSCNEGAEFAYRFTTADAASAYTSDRQEVRSCNICTCTCKGVGENNTGTIHCVGKMNKLVPSAELDRIRVRGLYV